MSSKGSRRAARRGSNKADRPSRFFTIAMTLGLIVFIWIMAQALMSKDDNKGPLERERSAAPTTTS